jgi:hypothetical protein
MIDLTIVLPDGRRAPVRLPGELPSGHVAEHTAGTLGVPGEAGHRWLFVRAATGEAFDPAVPLDQLGLAENEELQLAIQPVEPVTEGRGAIEQPTVVQPAVVQPTAAYAAGAPSPPGQPSAASPPAAEAAVSPAAAASSATPASSAAPNRAKLSPALIGGVAAAVVVLLGAGLLFVVLSGDDAPLPTSPVLAGASDDEDDPDTDGREESAAARSTGASSIGDAALEPAVAVTAFAVSLPPSWRTQVVEEPQDTAPGVTYTRTKLVALTGGTTLVIDDLIGFDKPAQANRADLDASYSANPSYRKVGFFTRSLPRTTAYEWRYVRDDDNGRPKRFSNMMFDLGDHSFAVLVGGAPTVPFDELSLLARRVARTVDAG